MTDELQSSADPAADIAASRKGHIVSYYSATSRLLPVYEPLRGKRETEICVVGGGLAGLWTAYELARHGIRTVILESRRIGWGASGRNGGFVSAGFAESIFEVEKEVGLARAQAMYRLSVAAVGRIRALVRDRGREDIILGNGWLKLIRHNDINSLERNAERMARDYGQNYRLLARDEVQQLVASERYRGALLDMAPFHVHPLNYCALMAELAAQAGVEIYEGSRARLITRGRRGYTVRTLRGNVDCRQVILATSALGGPSSKLNSAVLPVATYMVSAKSDQLAKAIRFRGCIGDTRRASDYYRLVGAGDDQRLLWGGRITTRVSQPFFLGRKIRRDILSVFPQLTDLEVECAWSGLMGYAVHKMPIIGKISPDIWAVTAFGGHGLNTTVMAGSLVARAISRGEDEWKLFQPYGIRWGGSLFGRLGVQFEYWRMRIADRLQESAASG
jgi:glycine/D-amino acid oxidase-like deaminating enzyme